MAGDQILCSYCPEKPCVFAQLEKAPGFCPTVNRPDLISEAREKLREDENEAMARDVARTWKKLGKLTRVEETIMYARLRGYQKLGLAFCVGLSDEARLLTNVLLNEGFDVVSVCCMCGSLCSDDVQLPEEDKIAADFRQPMCNPIGQATLLDSEGCQFNILLGLCVGDDTLFIKHSKAPVTVLAVKDRVLANNPLGVLYTSRNPFSRMKTELKKKSDK
ncbi:MAG: DUF1847 domain-containing protein [Dehalococcoidia bacterium]